MMRVAVQQAVPCGGAGLAGYWASCMRLCARLNFLEPHMVF